MKTFHYIPGTQTPDQFNEKLAAYCADHDVVDVDARCIGESLWISLTEAEDAPMAALLLSPYILVFTPGELGVIHRRVEEAQAETAAQGTEDEPQTVLKALPLIPEGFKSQGYMLMVTVVGVLEESP